VDRCELDQLMTTTPTTDLPMVTAAQGLGRTVVHLGHRNRFGAVAECNGRTFAGVVFSATADEITCRRCRKMVTA
jgi:ribosomal protein S27E